MQTIPNGHDPHYTQSRIDTISNVQDTEWTQPQMARYGMDPIPNGNNPKWIQSRMDTIPNGHGREYTRLRIDPFLKRLYPELALTFRNNYLSVVYVFLLCTLYKNAFNEKLILCVIEVTHKNKTKVSCCY